MALHTKWNLFVVSFVCFVFSWTVAWAQDVDVTYKLQPNIPRLIADKMPTSANTTRVTRYGDAAQIPECGSSALRVAKSALNSTILNDAAWKSFKVSFNLGKEVLKNVYGYKKTGDALELLVDYLSAENGSEAALRLSRFLTGKAGKRFLKQVAEATGKSEKEIAKSAEELLKSYPAKKGTSSASKKVFDKLTQRGQANITRTSTSILGCGDITVEIEIAPYNSGPHVVVTMRGDCKQKLPRDQSKLGAFTVVGRYGLPAKVQKQQNNVQIVSELNLPGRWDVVAQCRKKEKEEEKPAKKKEQKVVFQPDRAFTRTDKQCTDHATNAWLAFDTARNAQTPVSKKIDILRLAMRDDEKSHKQLLADVNKAIDELKAQKKSGRTAQIREQANVPLTKKISERSNLITNYNERQKMRNAELAVLQKQRDGERGEERKLEKAYLKVLQECVRVACLAGKGKEFGTGDVSINTLDDRVRKAIQRDILYALRTLPECSDGKVDRAFLEELERYIRDVNSVIEDTDGRFAANRPLNFSYLGGLMADKGVTAYGIEYSKTLQERHLLEWCCEANNNPATYLKRHVAHLQGALRAVRGGAKTTEKLITHYRTGMVTLQAKINRMQFTYGEVFPVHLIAFGKALDQRDAQNKEARAVQEEIYAAQSKNPNANVAGLTQKLQKAENAIQTAETQAGKARFDAVQVLQELRETELTKRSFLAFAEAPR